jgi:hypothetical protein
VAWDIIFYATAESSVPGADFLDGCPAKVRGTILAVLDAVAAAPPPAFSGGGKWVGQTLQIPVTSYNSLSLWPKRSKWARTLK